MKLFYKPFGLLFSVLGGLIAGWLFKRSWQAVTHAKEPPAATDRDRGWREVVTAALLQGAIFAGVKALIDRAGATGFERITGTWPGKTAAAQKKN